MTGLDITACEHALRELRDFIVPRDRVNVFNDTSKALLKHFVMHMAMSWHGEDSSSIASIVVPIAFLVANRIMYPKQITAGAVARATRRLPASASFSTSITPEAIITWIDRFTSQACQAHSFELVTGASDAGTTEFCKTCLVMKRNRAARRQPALIKHGQEKRDKRPRSFETVRSSSSIPLDSVIRLMQAAGTKNTPNLDAVEELQLFLEEIGTRIVLQAKTLANS